jgi:hypothetical protein
LSSVARRGVCKHTAAFPLPVWFRSLLTAAFRRADRMSVKQAEQGKARGPFSAAQLAAMEELASRPPKDAEHLSPKDETFWTAVLNDERALVLKGRVPANLAKRYQDMADSDHDSDADDSDVFTANEDDEEPEQEAEQADDGGEYQEPQRKRKEPATVIDLAEPEAAAAAPVGKAKKSKAVGDKESVKAQIEKLLEQKNRETRTQTFDLCKVRLSLECLCGV